MLIFSILLLIIFLIFPLNIAGSAKTALFMCLNSVVPSLFPFMVASKIIILSQDINENNILFRFLSKLFRISKISVWAFLLGLVCGYPIGAKTVCDLYRENHITKKEANMLLCFCNNGGPAFIIATVGGMFFNNISYGVFIYVCHVLSSITVGILIRKLQPPPSFVIKERKEIPDMPSIVTTAISDATLSMINVVGIIVFFAALFEALRSLNLITLFSTNPAVEGVICGLFEITSGIRILAASPISINLKLMLVSFLMSFSGISIFFQVLSFSNHLKLKITPYILCKVLSGILSMVYCALLLFLI